MTIWKKANITAILKDTKAFTTRIMTQEYHDVEPLWTLISNHLQTMISEHVPTKACSSRFHQPWITNHLKRLSRRKQRAWSKAKQSDSPSDWERYKLLKKETRCENRSGYQNYVKNLIDDNSTKKLWKFVKSRKCDTVGVAPLTKCNKTQTTNKDKATTLNDQFCSVFTQEDCNPHQVTNTDDCPIMPDITINVKGVQKLLEDLDPTKAAGPDEIPSRLLRMVATEIAPALTKLFQISIETSAIPIIWKHALVQPVFKKGDRSNAANYRPISLTCICCKLMEHIVRSAITEHIETNNLITDAQHGFRKQRSCETQLISLTHDIATEMNKRGQTDIILLDFSKAFDKVPHQRLLSKLHASGIRNRVFHWVKAFLDNRTQEVVVGGEKSESGLVTSGVPQGSVLGPTLFLIYINDLGNNIKSKIRLFADDTILYQHISTPADCHSLNQDLQKLQEWEDKWLMEFNASKCHAMTITNKKNPITRDYTLHGHRLERVNSAKYLGVELSSDLKWGKHVSRIVTKANQTSAFITRNLEGCPLATQALCFKALVRPILEYGNVIWDPHQQHLIHSLEMVQRRAARRMHHDFSPQTSASNLVDILGLERLETRRKRNKITTLFKVANRFLDIPASNHISYANRNTRGHTKKINIPTSRIDAHLHSFFPSTSRLWNRLPQEAVDAETVAEFSTVLSHIRPLS